MDPELQTFAVQLTDAAVRNSANGIADRIRTVKARKENEKTIVELEEIIEALQSDKSEILRIARAFEEEMVAQRISDEDVKFITGTVVPLLERYVAEDEEKLAQLRSIVSSELVNVLQVLGFNYRRAIGEPLTEVVAEMIRAQKAQSETLSADRLRNESLLLQLALDADATARFERLTGRAPSSSPAL